MYYRWFQGHALVSLCIIVRVDTAKHFIQNMAEPFQIIRFFYKFNHPFMTSFLLPEAKINWGCGIIIYNGSGDKTGFGNRHVSVFNYDFFTEGVLDRASAPKVVAVDLPDVASRTWKARVLGTQILLNESSLVEDGVLLELGGARLAVGRSNWPTALVVGVPDDLPKRSAARLSVDLRLGEESPVRVGVTHLGSPIGPKGVDSRQGLPVDGGM